MPLRRRHIANEGFWRPRFSTHTRSSFSRRTASSRLESYKVSVRKKGEIVDLGDWEYSGADSGLFVLPGVYTYGKIEYDKNGSRTIKPLTKLRGGDPKKYDATVKANQWLIKNVL